jgi:hypothetical protein
MKTCIICGKTEEDFYFRNLICRDCGALGHGSVKSVKKRNRTEHEKKLNRDYYKKNREKRIQTQINCIKKRRATNPEYAAQVRINTSFKNALKKNFITKYKKTFDYTGVPYSDYSDYFKNNFPVEFSELTIKGKYHIDHIIPCAVYDFNNPEDIKKCWNPKNLRIITAEENRKKNDKLDFDLIKKYNIEYLLPDSLTPV